MTTITEIAPDLFRLSIHVPELDLQFNHFLVRDQQPLLFHAGLKGMFPQLRDAVATLIDPAALRYVAWATSRRMRSAASISGSNSRRRPSLSAPSWVRSSALTTWPCGPPAA